MSTALGRTSHFPGPRARRLVPVVSALMLSSLGCSTAVVGDGVFFARRLLQWAVAEVEIGTDWVSRSRLPVVLNEPSLVALPLLQLRLHAPLEESVSPSLLRLELLLALRLRECKQTGLGCTAGTSWSNRTDFIPRLRLRPMRRGERQHGLRLRLRPLRGADDFAGGGGGCGRSRPCQKRSNDDLKQNSCFPASAGACGIRCLR